MAQLVKNRLQCQRSQFDSWVGKIRKQRLNNVLLVVQLGGGIWALADAFFPGKDSTGGSVVKDLPANAGDVSSIPESRRPPGE